MSKRTSLEIANFLNARLRNRRRPSEAKTFMWDTLAYTSTDECITWPYRYNRDRPHVKHGGNRYLNVCRILCEAQYGPPKSKDHQAAHSCGNGHLGCVNPRHLSWKTPKENSDDRYLHGTDPRGERNPRAKLNRDIANEIRRRAASASVGDLAVMYDVSRSTIRSIIVGERWV